jgi:hypothetical protein
VYFASYFDDGPHYAYLAVSDKAGNTNEAEWAFFVDSVNPKVSIKSPTLSIFKKSSATPLVVAAVSDNVDIAGIQLLIDAKNVVELPLRTKRRG